MKLRRHRWVWKVLLLLLIAAGAMVLYVRTQVKATPGWYARHNTSPEALRHNANAMDQKLIDAVTAAHRAQAAETRARLSGASRPATANSRIVLELSEDELNAFICKWAAEVGWAKQWGAVVDEPAIALEDRPPAHAGQAQGEIILAAKVHGALDAIISLHVHPQRSESGPELIFSPALTVMAGAIELPPGLYHSMLKGIDKNLAAELAASAPKAATDSRGLANPAMVRLAMIELLRHALDNSPVAAVLFIPEGASFNRYVPMTIERVQITDKTLRLTLTPMNGPARQGAADIFRRAATEPAGE